MLTPTLTHKITSIYAAYAPEFDVTAWGGCQDEALNNLAEAIRERRVPEQGGESPQRP
jgi:hypothetical protein